MQAGDLITSARNKYGVPAGSNRWNDTTMLGLVNDAASDIAKETDFPEAAYPITTIAGQREYQMIDCVKILRCYLIVNTQFAQPLPGSDLPTLEGDILMIYDQSSGQIAGEASYSPQWMAENPGNYPLTNSGQGRPIVPTALPYYSTTAGQQRGIYYHRGGNIGVVPPPAASGMILAVDHIPLQPIVSADSNLMIYPRVYTDALTYKMCEYMAMADRSAMAGTYGAHYKDEVPSLRTWLDNLWATKPKRFVPITKRTFVVRSGGEW